MDSRLIREGVQLHRGRDPSAVADLAARFVIATMARSIDRRGACRIALSGGSTPRATYERLAAPALAREVDWARVFVFFGDERMVPADDASSNYRMASEALLSKVSLPSEQIHRILGELTPPEAADRYAATIGDAPLDLVLLGMGDDGHVASLFPGSAELSASAAVLPSVAPLVPHSRVTLGLRLINDAEVVALLVTGSGKASRVREVFIERQEGRSTLPAARVAPRSGELHWFLDDAAAAELDSFET